ncbi:MAG: para-nitrobenzyl esterase [Thermoleophilaceae bacterium]|nr:para-nitrobenzyl esterase [Thermoleophilaceae bacterium]
MNGRRKALAAVVLVAIGLTTGCTLPRPPGNEPLRYRDQIFNTVAVTSNLEYGTAPDANNQPVALRLDLYQPPASDTQTNRPALVWVHGGGFSGGDKTNTVPVDVGNTFAKLGYVVVSINYRLLAPPSCTGNPSQAVCTTAAFEAQHDAQAAVRWLRANAATYKIDPNRIGIGGESAGAITATLVGLRSEDVGSSGNPGFPSTVGGFVSVSGGLPGGIFASQGDAWGLFFHGTADGIVPFQWSVQTSVEMLKAGVAAWLQPQNGAGHVPWAQYKTLYLEQANYFLYLSLDLAHAAGQPVSAARASERQLERLGNGPQAKRMLKRYPKLNHFQKRAGQLVR